MTQAVARAQITAVDAPRMNVWEQVDPELLEAGSLALADLAVRCICGNRVALRETFEVGSISPASGIGQGECGECGTILRVRIVIERRGI
jgi:hypothetical protein